ncbi:uncharacterized protein LOC144439142 [Glandiceps talaboti]
MLKLSLVQCLATVIVLLVDSVASQDYIDTEVLILGGGISGIAAAQTLHSNGIQDFIILEGDNDIGGRVKSMDFGGTRINLGANWIHFGNTSTNSIWQLKEKYNIMGKHADYDDLIILDSAGNNVTDYADVYWELLENATASDDVYNLLDQMQMGIVPDMSVRSVWKIGGWSPRSPIAKVVEYFEHDAEFAEPPEVTSFQSTHAVADELYEGGGDYFITDSRGFDVIVKNMADEFLEENDARLKLNHVVKKIAWNGDNVIVTTQNGTTFRADFALCTFSIGVLENDVVDFVPDLPYWKTEVIYQFHMAWFTKISIKFAEDVEQFWPEEEWMLVADERRGYYPVWGNLIAPGLLPTSEKMMLIIVTGEESKRIENQPDEETQDEVMSVLRGLFGETIPDPTHIHVSKWGTDPLQFGAYSNWPVEVSLESFRRLQAAVGKLYFAGEATHERYNGYLQGGLLSGQDRANDIINCINGNCVDFVVRERKPGCTYQQAINYDSMATVDDGTCVFSYRSQSSIATRLEGNIIFRVVYMCTALIAINY